MIRRPPRSTRTDTLFPYTTLFRSLRVEIAAYWRARERAQLDAERWRDRLLADDAAITEWVAAHPGIEVQPLRTLIRNARRERAVLEAAAAENHEAGPRSEARRVGKECVSTCRSRWSPSH